MLKNHVACIRIGPRCDVPCANTSTGHVLPWTKQIKYLEMFIVQSRALKCAIDDAICSFYRAANAIFAKVGKLASVEVTLQLIKLKCISVPLYGLVACPLNKTQLSSLDFAINKFLMKLFSTSNMEIITYCREQFDFELPSVILARHTSLLLDKLRHCDNCLIKKCYAYLTNLFCFDFV